MNHLGSVMVIMLALSVVDYGWLQSAVESNKRLLNLCLIFLLKEFEDTKGVIKIRKSKKDRQHYGQMRKDKRTCYDLQTC